VNRPTLVREANEGIASRAARLSFVSQLQIICECDGSDCSAVVSIGEHEYARIRANRRTFLTAPGHQLRRAAVQDQGRDYWIYRAEPQRRYA
jgi:hypothetical protein